MEIEHWELDKLKRLIEDKLPKEERKNIAIQTLGSIIAILGKHLSRVQGYSILATVLRTELRELGRKDARELREVIGLTKIGEKEIKTIISVAAIILGLELGVIENNKVVVKGCPFYNTLREFGEPFMCKACEEYNHGIVEELTNDTYDLEREKWLFNEDGYCRYTIKKRG